MISRLPIGPLPRSAGLPRENRASDAEGTMTPSSDRAALERRVWLGLSQAALVAPMVTGCASTGSMAPPTVTPGPDAERSVERARAEAPPAFRTLEAKASALNARRANEPHAKLSQEREALYREYARTERYGLDVDHDRDKLNLVREILYGTSDARADSDGDGSHDGYEVERGLDPASPQLQGAAEAKGWAHDYIPYSNNPMIEENTMLFYDLWVKQRTGVDPQLRYEEGASGLYGGDYFLASLLDERNAELTAAHDFDGNGVLEPGITWDFLKPTAHEPVFGTDGRTDTQLDVGWFGHCDPVAAAGILFREPKAAVELPLDRPMTIHRVSSSHGQFKAEWIRPGPTHTEFKLLSGQVVRLPNASITSTSAERIEKLGFEPRMLKELAAELVRRGSKEGTDWVGHRLQGEDATITLWSGETVRGQLTTELRGNARTVEEQDGRLRATKLTSPLGVRVWNASAGRHEARSIEPHQIRSVDAENRRDVPPIEFHETMLRWVGSDRKAAVMDKDSGPHVWNYSFDGYELRAERRADAPATVDYTMWVAFSGGGGISYSYSISYEGGEPVRGEWAHGSPNPDFFWRYRGAVEAFDHTNTGGATGLDFRTVMDLLKRSYAAEDAGRGLSSR